MFRCVAIEGEYWSAADLRLRCYDGAWFGFALYAGVFAVVYVVGFPLGVLALLFTRRHKLFGDPKDPYVATTHAQLGFLYQSYGATAWFWEVEELVRKLLLSAVVVLIEPGSPLQVLLVNGPRCFADGARTSPVCLELPRITGCSGHAGGAGLWMGARIARGLHSLGQRHGDVPAATRQPAGHVFCLPDGTPVKRLVLFSCVCVHCIECVTRAPVLFARIDTVTSAGAAVQSQRCRSELSYVLRALLSHAGAVCVVPTGLAVRYHRGDCTY
jgi:hypothetical protein